MTTTRKQSVDEQGNVTIPRRVSKIRPAVQRPATHEVTYGDYSNLTPEEREAQRDQWRRNYQNLPEFAGSQNYEGDTGLGSFAEGYRVSSADLEQDPTLAGIGARDAYMEALMGAKDPSRAYSMYDELASTARGEREGPSLADLQMQAAYGEQGRQLSSLLAGQRGMSAGLGANIMARQQADASQRLARESTMARLAEEQQRQQLRTQAGQAAGQLALGQGAQLANVADLAGKGIAGEQALATEKQLANLLAEDRAKELDIKRVGALAEIDKGEAVRAGDSRLGAANVAGAAGAALGSLGSSWADRDRQRLQQEGEQFRKQTTDRGMTGGMANYACGGTVKSKKYEGGTAEDTSDYQKLSSGGVLKGINKWMKENIGDTLTDVAESPGGQKAIVGGLSLLPYIGPAMGMATGTAMGAGNAAQQQAAQQQAASDARLSAISGAPGSMPMGSPYGGASEKMEQIRGYAVGGAVTGKTNGGAVKTDEGGSSMPSWVAPAIQIGGSVLASIIASQQSKGSPHPMAGMSRQAAEQNLQRATPIKRVFRTRQPRRGYADGGLVEGIDDPANDTVKALMSPGEIVLPLSVTMSEDAPELAEEFVEQEKRKKKEYFNELEGDYGVQQFADGGMVEDEGIEINLDPDSVDPSTWTVPAHMKPGAPPPMNPEQRALSEKFRRENANQTGIVESLLGQTIPGNLGLSGAPGAIASHPYDTSRETARTTSIVSDKPDFAAQAKAQAQQPEEEVAPPQLMQAPMHIPEIQSVPLVQAPEVEYDDSWKGEAVEAAKAAAEVEEQEANAAATIMDDHAKIEQGIMEKRDREIEQNYQRLGQLEQSILESNIDPGKFWTDKPAWQQITAAVGVALGAYQSAVTGGPNQALAIIDKAIDREIATQEKNLSTKKAMLSHFITKGHSLESSKQQTKAYLAKAVESKLKRDALRYAGPKAAAQVQQLSAELGRQSAKQAMQAATVNASNELQAAGMNTNIRLQNQRAQAQQQQAVIGQQLAQRKEQDKQIGLEYYDPFLKKHIRAKDKKTRDLAMTDMKALGPLDRYLKKAKSLFKKDKWGKWLGFANADVQELDVMREGLATQLNKLYGDARASNEDIERMKKTLVEMKGIRNPYKLEGQLNQLEGFFTGAADFARKQYSDPRYKPVKR